MRVEYKWKKLISSKIRRKIKKVLRAIIYVRLFRFPKIDKHLINIIINFRIIFCLNSIL